MRLEGAMEFTFSPIGVIHTPFTDQQTAPIQPSHSQAEGRVVVDLQYADGLRDLEGFSHLILLYVFHRASGHALTVTPFLDDQSRGLFATRYPRRPNTIGLSVVRLLSCDENVLAVGEVDMLNGTPLLDIKPYVPDFDMRGDVRTGWYSTRAYQDRVRLSGDGGAVSR